MSMEEFLKETRELIKQLKIETEIYTYSSNYLRPGLLYGRLPKDREYMLSVLDFALAFPGKSLYLQSVRFI